MVLGVLLCEKYLRRLFVGHISGWVKDAYIGHRLTLALRVCPSFSRIISSEVS